MIGFSVIRWVCMDPTWYFICFVFLVISMRNNCLHTFNAVVVIVSLNVYEYCMVEFLTNFNKIAFCCLEESNETNGSRINFWFCFVCLLISIINNFLGTQHFWQNQNFIFVHIWLWYLWQMLIFFVIMRTVWVIIKMKQIYCFYEMEGCIDSSMLYEAENETTTLWKIHIGFH